MKRRRTSLRCPSSFLENLLLRYNADQHCADNAATGEFPVVFVVVLAGDEGEPVIIFVLEQGGQAGGGYQPILPDLIDVHQSIGVDHDHIIGFEFLDVAKGQEVPVWIGGMAGEDGVARPGGIGRAFEITGFVAQPGYVPAVVLEWNTNDGLIDA